MRSIAFRLIVAFLCIVSLLILQGAFAYYTARSLASVQHRALTKKTELQVIQKELSEMRLTVYKLLGTMNPYSMDLFKQEFERKMSRLLKQFKKHDINLELLRANKNTYTKIINYQYDFSIKTARNLLDNFSKKQHEQLTSFVKTKTAEISKETQVQIRTAHRKSFFFTVGICLLALVVSIVWALLLANSFTDRKRAEETLREQYVFLQTLINTIPNPVFYKDRKGKYTGCNRAFAEFIGKAPEEIVGKTVYDIAPDKDLAEIYFAADIELFEKQGTQTYESSVLRYNGQMSNVIFNKACITDHKGTTTGLVGIISDITERIRTEELLQKSEERFRSLVENINDIIWEVDENSTYTYMSPAVAKVLGYSSDELIGKKPFEIMPPDEAERVRNLFLSLADRKEPFKGMININIHKKGYQVTLESSGVPIIDSKGNLAGYRGVDRDITERKSMEERLQQSQKMEAIGTLAGGIAHDFNNILAGIIGYTELAQDDTPSNSNVQNYLQQIMKSTTRAKDLVRQILTFSRKGQEERKPVSLHPIIKEAAKLLRSTIPTTIDIRLNIDEHAGKVNADPTQMHQIVMNLCTNASFSMQEHGGEMEISLAPVVITQETIHLYPDVSPGPFVEIGVTDTGSGIDSRILQRIFEPFFTTKEKEKGTGMGLAVVHGIVKDHGGVIHVESMVDKGTTVTVLLPRVIADTSEKDESALSVSRGNEHILFIDDEKILMDLGKKRLESLGYTVTALNSSLEALEVFRQSPDTFDMVITDQTMPHMTGLELAKQILQIMPDKPVIICTGYSDTVSPERAELAGIKALIYKPITKIEFASTIRSVFDNMT